MITDLVKRQTEMTDWRYCKCSHKADDHNPLSLNCYLCDCKKWQADMTRSLKEKDKLDHELLENQP